MYLFVADDDVVARCFELAYSVEGGFGPGHARAHEPAGNAVKDEVLGTLDHRGGDIFQRGRADPLAQLAGD